MWFIIMFFLPLMWMLWLVQFVFRKSCLCLFFSEWHCCANLFCHFIYLNNMFWRWIMRCFRGHIFQHTKSQWILSTENDMNANDIHSISLFLRILLLSFPTVPNSLSLGELPQRALQALHRNIHKRTPSVSIVSLFIKLKFVQLCTFVFFVPFNNYGQRFLFITVFTKSNLILVAILIRHFLRWGSRHHICILIYQEDVMNAHEPFHWYFDCETTPFFLLRFTFVSGLFEFLRVNRVHNLSFQEFYWKLEKNSPG